MRGASFLTCLLVLAMTATALLAVEPTKKESRSNDVLEPWASMRHPQDVPRIHVEQISAGKQTYVVTQRGTMDGENCRSPIGGGFGIWQQSWESNRTVRMENVGQTDVVNPWLSNGKNEFRSLKDIVAATLQPEMSDREKAIALWRLQTTHRFHASTTDSEANDPVKVFNVYGYTTCGDDSICMAGLWRTAGFQVRPARLIGHCITQVFYDGRWNLLDGDMGPIYLLRDNETIASEQDLVRDHELLKRTHSHGILDPDSRFADEYSAGMFVYEGQTEATRNSPRDTTMNMILRPNEGIVWRWGHLVPPKYHGRADIKVWPKADERICNGLWEYRPDFTQEFWRKGAESVDNVRVENGMLFPDPEKTGAIVWKLRSPYVFTGGRLEVEGSKPKLFVSLDGNTWQAVEEIFDAQFPSKGAARYEYRLKCELPPGASLKRLAIINDLQMAPLSLPAMAAGENQFAYSDQSAGERSVRITHEWIDRSVSKPPTAPLAAIYPADGGKTDGTDIAFQWEPAKDSDGDKIADYHFELSDRADLRWPLSPNFAKLMSNTADRGGARYTLTSVGLLTPGRQYYWHVRAKDAQGVWGTWSATWQFTAGGPAQPLDVHLHHPKGHTVGTLRWKANSIGNKPVKYRIYGSDEKGFSVSDTDYKVNVGISKDVPSLSPANFVAETSETALKVLDANANLPNLNKAFYRVVAVDENGKRSGPSDYAAAPRPFLYGKPIPTATVETPYRSQVFAIRSVGDLRTRTVDGKIVANFWDIEQPQFTLLKGPAWLKIDKRQGVLSGTPTDAGTADIEIAIALEKPVFRLDEARLSWGQEKVLEVGKNSVGSITHRFQIDVVK